MGRECPVYTKKKILIASAGKPDFSTKHMLGLCSFTLTWCHNLGMLHLCLAYMPLSGKKKKEAKLETQTH